jgi:hypothetical protein
MGLTAFSLLLKISVTFSYCSSVAISHLLRIGIFLARWVHSSRKNERKNKIPGRLLDHVADLDSVPL